MESVPQTTSHICLVIGEHVAHGGSGAPGLASSERASRSAHCLMQTMQSLASTETELLTMTADITERADLRNVSAFLYSNRYTVRTLFNIAGTWLLWLTRGERTDDGAKIVPQQLRNVAQASWHEA